MSVCKAGAPVKKPARLARPLRWVRDCPWARPRAHVCTEAQAGALWYTLGDPGAHRSAGMSAKPDNVFGESVCMCVVHVCEAVHACVPHTQPE